MVEFHWRLLFSTGCLWWRRRLPRSGRGLPESWGHALQWRRWARPVQTGIYVHLILLPYFKTLYWIHYLWCFVPVNRKSHQNLKSSRSLKQRWIHVIELTTIKYHRKRLKTYNSWQFLTCCLVRKKRWIWRMKIHQGQRLVTSCQRQRGWVNVLGQNTTRILLPVSNRHIFYLLFIFIIFGLGLLEWLS